MNKIITTLKILVLLSIVNFVNAQTTVTDYDGNVYHTIKIGNQIWTVEDLRVTHLNDGTPIPNVTDPSKWGTTIPPAYCDYNNDPKNAATYGRLYNLNAANANIAPAGWHVPKMSEFNELFNALGGKTVAGGKLKEQGTTHWLTTNTGADNSSGFTALPIGNRFATGEFDGLGKLGFWWPSADSVTQTGFFVLCLRNSTAAASMNPTYENLGLGIRLVKDKTLDVEENENKTINIYPNPAVDEIFISTEIKSDIKIFNMSGQLVKQFTSEQINNSYNISDLTKGIYTIVVTNEREIKYSKVIK